MCVGVKTLGRVRWDLRIAEKEPIPLENQEELTNALHLKQTS